MGKHVKPNEKRSAVPGKSSAASGQPYKRTESRTARSVRLGSFGFAGELGVVAAAFALALLLRYIPVTGWARVAAFVVPLAIAGYPAFIKAVDEAARLEFMKPDFIFSRRGARRNGASGVFGGCRAARRVQAFASLFRIS